MQAVDRKQGINKAWPKGAQQLEHQHTDNCTRTFIVTDNSHNL